MSGSCIKVDSEADGVSTMFSSCTSSPTSSSTATSVDMKDVLPSSSRASRHTAYLKKRPSPHGVSKSRKPSSPVYIPLGAVRKTPRAVKAELVSSRHKTIQLAMMRRDGIYLEEEYREEIRRYMHDMEVSEPHIRVAKFAKLFHNLLALHCGLYAMHGPATGNSVAHAALFG